MTQQEVMKTFMQSLNDTELSGRAALDEAVKASSSFGSYQEVVNNFASDWENAKGNWYKFLVEKCGIILDNVDTGAISGADCGSATVKGAQDILPSKGSAKYPSGTSFTVRGLTIYGIPPRETLTADQQYVVRGLYSWWVRDALKQIEESYGISYKDENTTNARLKLEFFSDPTSSGLAAVSFGSLNGTKKEYQSGVLTVNMAKFENMSSSDRQGKSGGLYLSRTLIHELVHGVMASNINYFGDLPSAILEGGTAELIHGVDDKRRTEIIEYAKDLSPVIKILGMEYSSNSQPYEAYAGGYMFMRYFLKQAAADTTFDYDTYRSNVTVASSGGFATNYHDTVTMTGGKGSDTITNAGSNVIINAGAGVDTVKNYNSNVIINAGSGADNISNSGGSSVSINAGSGNDNIYNESSNSTLFGGKGNDAIMNLGEYNIIFGNAGDDTVFNQGAYTSVSGDEGADRILNIKTAATLSGGTGVDTLTNTGDNSVIFGDEGNDIIANGFKSSVDTSYSADLLNDDDDADADSDSDSDSDTVEIFTGANSTVYGGAGNDSITNYAKTAKIYGGAGIDSIENSGASVKIYGNEGADIIDNEGLLATVYGGADNDIIANVGNQSKIYGGAGNDSIDNEGQSVYISLGEGADSIANSGESSRIYGNAGNDYFYNFGDGSTISGGAGIDSIRNFANEVIISGDAGNDSIYSSGIDVMISGGAGNDSIRNEGMAVVIEGVSGDDYIYNTGDFVSIAGGAGNDSIVNRGGKHLTYAFNKSGGNDTVIGANNNDTLQITSGSYSTSLSGNNLIVKVGKSSITFMDFGENNLIINGKSSSANISEIVADEFIGDTEFAQEEKITQKNLITFAE